MEEKLIHKELLRLVRSALWHNEELPVSYDEELLSPVFRASRQQAVSALVAQALLSNNVRTNDEGAMEIMSILMGQHAIILRSVCAVRATLISMCLCLIMSQPNA